MKEDAAAEGEPLPDRAISEHPNYVTERGLALIETELERLHRVLADAADDRAARGAIERELRYWTARRASAEVVPPSSRDVVRFGASVTIERADGRRQTWRIVGEDEADPKRGSLPYVAPLARALTGKQVGDTVRVGDEDAEIVEIG